MKILSGRTSFDESKAVSVKMTVSDFATVAPLPDLSEHQPGPRTIRIPANEPMQQRCAWCDEDAGFRVVGNCSHRVCFYHMVSNLWFSLPKDSLDTLVYALFCAIGTEDK